MTERNK